MLLKLGLFTLFFALTFCQKEYNPQIHRVKIDGGLSYYYYYVNIYVGTPPQRQALIIDTGSTKTIFPCIDCQIDSCGQQHLNQYFDYKQSSTYQPLKCQQNFENFQCTCQNPDPNLNNQCTFSQVEGSSYQGHYMIDQAIFGEELYQAYQNKTLLDALIHEKYFDIQTKLIFGCATIETKLFKTQKADGIIGLGPETNQQNTQPNLIDMAFRTHNHTNEKLQFSICLGIQSGYMQIGGYDTQDHLKDGNNIKIKYNTSLVNANDQYGIIIHKFKIGNETFQEDLSTFIDSGTTYTYFPDKQYNFIMSQIKIHCQDQKNCLGEKNREYCYLYNKNKYNITIQEFFDSFPTIYFQFDDNQMFEWPPMDYLYEKNKYNFCISIESGQATLGQTFMRYNDILFDREQKQITIKKALCSEYLFGNGEVYQPSIIESIKDQIQQFDYGVIAIIILVIILTVGLIVFLIIKKWKKHEKLPSDEKVMIQQENRVQNNGNQNNNKNDLEKQQDNQFQIENYGQNIEMAYKDIYQEKLEEDDNSKVKEQLADFQKFNFETN